MTSETPPDSPAPSALIESGKYFEISREEFDTVPLMRGRYILTYLAVFFAWIIATFTQFYYETEEVPLTAEEIARFQPADPDETDEAAEIPSTRIAYSWKWTWPVIAYQILLAAGMIYFYTQFAKTLRLMGYPWLVIIGYCTATLLPLPGILAVAFFDRQIAKTWNKADDALIARDRELRQQADET